MPSTPEPTAAFFDVDGTLLDTNIVHFYVRYRTAEMTSTRRMVWKLGFLRRVPALWFVDKINRAAFNRLFYLMYQGMDAEAVRRLATESFESFALPRLFPGARDAVEAHRSRGDRIVLVSGSTDFVVAPLAEHLRADETFTVSLEERDGVFTGNLVGEPLSDVRKAEAVRAYAATHGINLSGCYAYGDSVADAPMLEVVGNPVAVNPSRRLWRLARERGWRIERWRPRS
jgi:HAD superfamily hydrolase (TIGR01490 family)